MCLGANILLIQGLQNGMPGTVGCRTGACSLLATKIHALPAKLALINRAVVES